MPLKTLLTGLFLSVMCLVPPALSQSAQNSRDELIALLGRLPEIAPIRNQLVAQGFQGEKLALAEAHSKRVMTDDLIAGYIADRLIALYDGRLSAASATEGLIAPLYESGITHLPVKELVYYHKVQRVLLDGMTPRDCGLLVKGQLRPARMEDVIGRAEARLSARTLKEFYRIQYKAMRLGVTRAPRQLSPAEAARIQTVIFEAVRKRVESASNAKALSNTLENFERARNATACEAAKVFAEAVLDITGRDQQKALLFLSAP